MTALSQRMRNSTSWWRSEIRRRHDERSHALQVNLSGLYLITVVALAVIELFARHTS